jgi:hypothetical protein
MKARIYPAYLSAFLFLLSSSCVAQIGIYGKLNLSRFNDRVDHTTNWFYGPGGGIYYDFLPLGPIAFGLDLRGSYEFANQLVFRSGLGGVRLVVRPPLLPIRPYVEGSAGVAGMRATSSNSGLPMNFSNKFAYEVLAGLDLTILPHIDLRLPEVGYGHVNAVTGGSGTMPSSLFEISTGVVIRLP